MIPVSAKETPATMTTMTRGKISFQRTKPGDGEQFLPLDCREKARMTGVAALVSVVAC